MAQMQVVEYSAFERKVLGTFDSLADAKRGVPGKIMSIYEDDKNPGHYDLITFAGKVYAIEPVKKD